MPNSHSLFSLFKQTVFGCLLLTVTTACAHPVERLEFAQYKNFVIYPLDTKSDTDTRWADYLSGQATKRSTVNGLVSKNIRDSKENLYIAVHIAPSADADYQVTVDGNRVCLNASSDATMLWLVYQWLALTGETDSRWVTDDLDPPVLELDGQGHTFDFSYRSLYSPSLSDPDRIALTANRHVDYHWGLWGHNLKRVFPGEVPDEARALTRGRRSREQFCFSSDELYEATVNFIIDNYGDGPQGDTTGFAILPDDNTIVCMCDLCQKAGNTPESATPAVTAFLKKLAARFPSHQFYTSAYATTKLPPEQSLPGNAGVIVSAIELPLTAHREPAAEYAEWRRQLQGWQQVTHRIIVWDYMRNFDDYLTPYPSLCSIQQRLQWFKSLGIQGVFYNGSGDDYAILDDVQSYTISSLMKNTDLNVKELVYRYLHHFYPQSGQLIADYYWQLENRAVEKRCRLGWYEGIEFAVENYLDIAEFRRFYDTLDRLSKQTSGEERHRLNQMLTALDFTQLELIRCGHGEMQESQDFLELLAGYKAFPNLTKYKEANGLLSDYISSWNRYPVQAQPKRANARPATLSVIETESGKPVGQLTDGYYGFPHDYHLHWYISTQPETRWQIKSSDRNLSRLVLSFLNSPVWKIGQPSAIEVSSADGRLIGQWKKGDNAAADFEVCKIGIDITPGQYDSIEIKITRGNQPKIACDEIEWYETNY